jgi:hypothetical protein
MLLISFMAYRSPLEIRDGLVTIPDTPLFSDRHHPVSRIAREFESCDLIIAYQMLMIEPAA